MIRASSHAYHGLIPRIRRIKAITPRSTPKLWIIGTPTPQTHYNDITRLAPRSGQDALRQECHNVIQKEQ